MMYIETNLFEISMPVGWAGKKTSPAVITVYSTVQPVGTTVLSFIAFGTLITVPEVVGGFLVACGLILTGLNLWNYFGLY